MGFLIFKIMGKPKTKFKILENREQLDKLIEACYKTGYASYDFEATGNRIYNNNFYPTILGVSFEPGRAGVIPLGHFDSPWKKDYKKQLKYFGKEVIENPDIVKIGWNIKFDNQIMQLFGVNPKGRVFDGMLAKYILDEIRPHDLKSAVRRFQPKYGDYEEDYEGCKLPWDKRPLLGLSQYCAIDCDMTLRLFLFLEKKLMELGMYPLFRNLIMPASKLLTKVETRGQRLDSEWHGKLQDKYPKLIDEAETKVRNLKKVRRFEKSLIKSRVDKYLEKLEEEVNELKEKEGPIRSIKSREEKIARIRVGQFTTKNELKLVEPINFGSSQQMTQLLFTSEKGFKFPIVKYTKKDKKDTDNPSSAEAVLLELQKVDKSGFIDTLLELRGLKQINNMFVKGFANLVQDDGRLHPKFHIQGCVTPETKIIGSERDIRIGTLVPKKPGTKYIGNKGILVLTHDGTYQLITHGINKGLCETWQISDDLGNMLNCTPQHKLLTRKGMKTVQEIIKKQLTVISMDTSFLDFEKPKETPKPKKVIFRELYDIPGYIASNEGDIYSLKVLGSQGKSIGEPHSKLPRISKSGYRRVWLGIGKGKKKPYKVSQLVWEAFNRRKVPEGYVIYHIDTIKTNDNINNLQLLTKSENIKKAYSQTRLAYTQGSINGMAKLNSIIVGNILYDLKKGISQQKVANKYGCSQKQVSRILNKQAWGQIYLTKIHLVANLGLQPIVDLTVDKNHSYVTRSNFINSNTVSGRLSSSEPNAQQFPRLATNPDIRKCLIASPGRLYLMMDYSQAELRIMAHLSKCKGLLEAFARGWDPHLSVACKKYGCKYEDIEPIYNDELHPDYKIWKVRRKQAKHIVFGCIYCIGAEKLAEELSDPKTGLIVTAEEAKEFLNDFFTDFPEVKKFMDKQMKFMHKHGYVKTLFGRKRRCPEVFGDNKMQIVEAEHASVNIPCQGSASDMALFASILIDEKVCKGELPDLQEVGTVHDSIYFDTLPQDINPKTVYQLWQIAKNPNTKKYFGFQINDIDMSMDFEIGRSQGEELPFAVGYDYNRLLNFKGDWEGSKEKELYFSYVNKCKNVPIKDYPKVYPEYFK